MADGDELRQDYPPFVTTEQARERWDLAAGIAREVFGDMGESMVWSATRILYNGDIPTHP